MERIEYIVQATSCINQKELAYVLDVQYNALRAAFNRAGGVSTLNVLEYKGKTITINRIELSKLK